MGTNNVPIRAIFFDIDGTLLSFRTKTMPESARMALQEAKRRGLLLFAATGRHILALGDNRHLRGVDFSGYVAMNGQYCTAGDEVIYSNPLDRRDLVRILEYVSEHPLECLFHEADIVYMDHENTEIVDIQQAIGSPIPKVCRLDRALTNPVYQVCVYTPEGDTPSVVQQLEHSTYARWHMKGMDIIPAKGSKWIGIEHMLAHFGLRADEVAAVGDGDNDLEMLQNAGVSIAMGNATDKLKAVADYVTDHLEQDGILHALQWLMDTHM